MSISKITMTITADQISADYIKGLLERRIAELSQKGCADQTVYERIELRRCKELSGEITNAAFRSVAAWTGH